MRSQSYAPDAWIVFITDCQCVWSYQVDVQNHCSECHMGSEYYIHTILFNLPHVVINIKRSGHIFYKISYLTKDFWA